MSVGRGTFEALMGDTVDVALEGAEPVSLTVDELTDHDGGQGKQFSVFFTGPARTPLSQGIHRVLAHDLQPLDLFIVPVAREDDRLRYEAVFNYLSHDA